MCGFVAVNFGLGTQGIEAVRKIGWRGLDALSDIVHFGNWTLVHSRLNLTDYSPDNNQPVKLDGSRMLLYNGEIFNLPILCKKYDLPSISSDVEFLRLAINNKRLCVSDIEGFFSIVVLNADGSVERCARDRFGVKPLYIYDADKVAISSDETIIAELLNLSVSNDAVEEYRFFRWPALTGSFFDLVNRVKPGTCYVDGKYFDLKKMHPNINYSYEQKLDNLRTALVGAFKMRQSDRFNSALLYSAGVDSNLIYALANKHIELYSCAMVEDFDFHKLQGRQEVHLQCYDEVQLLRDMNKLVSITRTPLSLPNEAAIYSLCYKFKEENRLNKIVFSGDGADELFAGYDRIFSFFREKDTIDVNHFLKFYGYSAAPKRIRYFLEQYFAELHGLSSFSKLRIFFLEIHLPGLLGRLDRASMAAGVEAREPFLSYEVVSCAFSFTEEELFLGSLGKKPLRDLLYLTTGSSDAYLEKSGFPIKLCGTSDEQPYELWQRLNIEAVGW